MNNIKDICCGCRSCFYNCPKNAIIFIKDEYGFEYPQVDETKCTNCGYCKQICPALNIKSFESGNFFSGYAISKNKITENEGSSGGLFGTFATYTIKNGGVVFGAAFDNNLKLKTVCAENEEELKKLYKSKYLLCDTNNTFEKIKEYLDKNISVLYCSTPCQISALRLYLKKDYDNLLTVDILCHGVGNQYFFDKSIQYFANKYSDKIKNFIFRYKIKNPNSNHYYKIIFEKKKEIKDIYFNFPYYYAFYDDLNYRNSCYECPYATPERPGDITIGDFHKLYLYKDINKYAPKSMILVNTEKGNRIFQKISSELVFGFMDKDILYKNNRFFSKTINVHSRELLLESLKNEDFKITVKKYLTVSLKKRIFYRLPSFLINLIIKARKLNK